MEKIIYLNRLDNLNKREVKMVIELTAEMARVHAHLCGDGSVCIWRTKERDRNFTAVIGYYNNNQRLLNKFREDFSKIFHVRMKMRNNRDVYVRSIRIFNELTNQFGKFGSREWRIHDSIKKSAEQIRLEWLKAFFEDEAYHEKKNDRLKTKSVNFSGLKDVKCLLDSLGIYSTLTGPNCDRSYYLTIPKFSSVQLFSDFIKEPARK